MCALGKWVCHSHPAAYQLCHPHLFPLSPGHPPPSHPLPTHLLSHHPTHPPPPLTHLPQTGLDFGSFGTWLTPPDDVFLERLSKTTVQPVSRQAFWQFREAWVARNGPVLRWWQREWDRADAGE